MSSCGENFIISSKGQIEVKNLKVGDSVICFNNDKTIKDKIISITPDFKKCIGLKYYNSILGYFSEDQLFWTIDPRYLISREKTYTKSHDYIIRKSNCDLYFDGIDEPHAYSIGAFLGDGCSTYLGKQKYISSENINIPEKIRSETGANFVRKNSAISFDYTWVITNEKIGFKGGSVGGREVKCNHYNDWCKGRKAHQKIIDIDIINSWNRESCIRYLAGLFDTDGSLDFSEGKVTLKWGMQAKIVIQSIQHLIFKLWNYYVNITIDNRKKYKNGPLYLIGLRNNLFSRKILKEITPHLVCNHKKYDDKMNKMNGKSNEYYIKPKIFDKKEMICFNIILENNSKLILANQGLVFNSQ